MVLLVALLAGLIAWWVARRRDGRRAAWRGEAEPVLAGILAARDLLPATAGDIVDVSQWERTRGAVEDAAVSADRVAATAASTDDAGAARDVAAGLRQAALALETGRLLRDTPAAGREEVATAEAAAGTRRSELDAALARLQAVVHPPAH